MIKPLASRWAPFPANFFLARFTLINDWETWRIHIKHAQIPYPDAPTDVSALMDIKCRCDRLFPVSKKHTKNTSFFVSTWLPFSQPTCELRAAADIKEDQSRQTYSESLTNWDAWLWNMGGVELHQLHPGKNTGHPVRFKVGHVHIVRPELPAHIKTIICDHEPSANLIEYLVECIK